MSLANLAARSSLLGACALAAGLVLLSAGAGAAAPSSRSESGPRGTRLTIDGTRFAVNGRPEFLLGISYYAALGAPAGTVRRDLAAMKRYGFRWLRVWATCDFFGNDVAAVDGSGRPREPFASRLRELVAESDRRGLIVDVTLARGTGGPPRLATLAEMRTAVESVISILDGRRNWYLDLANERNVGDRRYVSFDELTTLRAAARASNPDLLVTASEGGDIDREELRDYLVKARVDFVCPHRPRDAGSPAQTEAKTRELLAWMEAIDPRRVVPVHYQEPFRRDYGAWQPRAEDFAADLAAARAGGAAGWCFHNGGARGAKEGRPRRSFDLRDGLLFDQLDVEECRFLAMLSRRDHPGNEEKR